jgi:hypothetical protein
MGKPPFSDLSGSALNDVVMRGMIPCMPKAEECIGHIPVEEDFYKLKTSCWEKDLRRRFTMKHVLVYFNTSHEDICSDTSKLHRVVASDSCLCLYSTCANVKRLSLYF